MVSIFTKIKNLFKKKESTTTKDVTPTTSGVKVTDFTSGESIKTTVSGNTTTRIVRGGGGGGGSLSNQTAQELVAETEKLEAGGKSALVPSKESAKTLQIQRGDQFLTPEENAQAEELDKKVQTYAENRIPFYQNQINQGKLTVDEATDKLRNELTIYGQNLQQDLQYQQYKKDRISRPFASDYVTVNLPSQVYAGQKTVSNQATQILLTKEQYYREPTIPSGTKILANIVKNIPTSDLFISTKKTITNPLGLAQIKIMGNTGDINLRELRDKAILDLDQKSFDLIKNELETTGIREKIEPNFQQEYQIRFENKYAEDIIYGRINYEDAVKEFEKTKEAQILQKEYSETLNKERSKLGLTKAGFKVAGLQFASSSLSLVPTTTTGLGLTGAGAYGLSKLPKVVDIGIGTYIGLTSTKKLLSKTSLPEERAGGLFGAGTVGLLFGYGAYRYLRSPLVRTEEIIPTLTEFDTPILRSGTIERGIAIDTFGNAVTVDLFNVEKATQNLQIGRRTVVTTPFREFLGLDPIYSGVPTRQRLVSSYPDFFGRDLAFTKLTDYEKAFNKLTDYGYTPSQAGQTIRYYQPKIFRTRVTGKIAVIYTDNFEKAILQSNYERTIQQPIIKYGGGKTRGGRTIKEFITGGGKRVGSIGDYDLYGQDFSIERVFPTAPKGRTTTLFKQLSAVRLDKEVTGFLPTGKVGELDVFKLANYEKFSDKSIIRQILPRKRKNIFSEDTLVAFRGEPKLTYTRDLREEIGINAKEIIRPTKNIPQAKIEDLSKKEIKQLLKDLKDIYGNAEKPTLKEIYETPKQPSQSSTSGLVLQQEKLIQGTLPTPANIPTTRTLSERRQVDRIIKELERTKVGTRSKQYLSSALSQNQFSNQKLNALLGQQEKLEVASLLAQAQKTRTKQFTLTLTEQSTRQQLKNALQLDLSLNRPLFRTGIPTARPPKIPLVKPFGLPDLPKLNQILRRKKKSKAFEERAYLPDFTARAIGLEPEVISGEDALKKVNKLLTGLEVRRGIKFK